MNNHEYKTSNGFYINREVIARMEMIDMLNISFICAEDWTQIEINGEIRQFEGVRPEINEETGEWTGKIALGTYAANTWIDGSGDDDEDYNPEAFDVENDHKHTLYDGKHADDVSELVAILDKVVLHGLHIKYR
jgi:hypothetical protein